MSSDRLTDPVDRMFETTGLACSYVEAISRSEFLADKRTQQGETIPSGHLARSGLRPTADIRNGARPH